MERFPVRLLRFETAVAAVVLAIAVLAANVYVPYSKRLFRRGEAMWVFLEFKGQATGIAERKKRVERDMRLLDSLFSVYDQGTRINGKSVMGDLYRFAETAGLQASKVEIGERMRIGDHYETTVTVRGTGTYVSVGRFCEAIENMPAPARIRQVSIGAEQGGTLGAVIDFAVLTK